MYSMCLCQESILASERVWQKSNLESKELEKFFYFHYLPKLYFSFKGIV